MFGRTMCVAAAAICVAGVVGCEKEVDQTEPNLQGAWRAPFADAMVTISLYPDNTYSVESDPDGKTGGQQLYLMSDFGKIPPVGEWRLGDKELVFSEAGRTVGGLEIAELTQDTVLLKANDGAVMFFDRKNLNGTSAFGAGGGGGLTGWDDEGMDEEGMDEDAGTTDDEAATQESGIGATTRPAGE